MMKKLLFLLLAAAGLGALGWWAYVEQRGPAKVALEIPASRSGASGAPASGPPPAGAPAGRPGGPAGAAGPGGPGPGGPVGVEVSEARIMSLSTTISAVGTLRAAESVVIKPEIPGRISRIGFEGGARVKRGDLLFELDAVIASAEVEQTRAELGLAQANYQRTLELAQKQFVSESARDDSAAKLRVLEARLKLSQARLSKTEIRAPFAGVLGLRNISLGDFVKEGAELVVLEDISSMKVDLRLPERYLGLLRPGQRVKVEFDAWPGKGFEAQLEAVDAQLDVNGRAVIARGRLPNSEGVLRTGMFAKATLRLSDNPSAIVIPEEAITPGGSDLFVYRIVDGKAMRTRVTTGQRVDGLVEITSGLAEGSVVVIAGQLKLQRDGQPVRLLGRERAPAAKGG